MRNYLRIGLATMLAAACGGGGTATSKDGNVSVAWYAVPVPTPAQSATLDVYTDAAGTIRAPAPNNTTKNFSACSPAIPTPGTPLGPNCWDSIGAKFNKVTLNLDPAAGPYYVVANFFNVSPPPALPSAALLATSTPTLVTFSATGAGTLVINPAVNETPAANGVSIKNVTSSLGASGFGSMFVGQTDTFNVGGAVDSTSIGATFTYAWSLAGAPTCGGTLSAATGSSSALSGVASGNKCKITLTATSSTLLTATLTWTVSVANDTSVSGGVAAPIIKSVSITSLDPSVTCTTYPCPNSPVVGDIACSLTKPAGGWNTFNTTCPGAFKLAATGLAPASPYNAQSYFGVFSVQYDLAEGGLDPMAAPTVSVATFCTNATQGWDPAKLLSGGAPVLNSSGDPIWPTFSVSPGVIQSTTVTPPSTVLQSDPAYWPEPVGASTTFAAAGGAIPLDAPATASNCTFQIIVKNQGGVDRLNVYANFSE